MFRVIDLCWSERFNMFLSDEAVLLADIQQQCVCVCVCVCVRVRAVGVCRVFISQLFDVVRPAALLLLLLLVLICFISTLFIIFHRFILN